MFLRGLDLYVAQFIIPHRSSEGGVFLKQRLQRHLGSASTDVCFGGEQPARSGVLLQLERRDASQR